MTRSPIRISPQSRTPPKTADEWNRRRRPPPRSLDCGGLSTARIRAASVDVQSSMLGIWFQDIESLEAISQNVDARKIFLRMAAMSQTGRIPGFLAEIALDQELDDTTKGDLTELARDQSCLLAVEEYLRCTQRVH